ncbi:MAG: DUF4129 domain-containing protein [Bacteroidia bacterium]|nr:DUF4129 domain-containing protein [Bacteroidia bacterium]
MIQRIVMCLGLILASSLAFAQLSDSPRSFSARQIDSLRQVKEYQYGLEPVEKNARDESENIQIEEEGPPAYSQAIQIIMYFLLGGLLIVVAFLVIRQFAGSEGKRVAPGFAQLPENVETLTKANYSSLIQEAESNSDWRLALRYHHLRALQLLQARKQIDWHAHKTDADYLLEIKDQALQQAFAALSRSFAYVWYGERAISQEQYDAISNQIHPFQ